MQGKIHFGILFLFLAAGAAFGGTWYAKPTPTGTGNCSSWANACTLNQAVVSAGRLERVVTGKAPA